MPTATATRPDAGLGNGDEGTIVVRPQTIGIAAESQRVQAEIQSALMVAKSCPRDEVEALDRIKTACQRPGLAENSEYTYSRGGTEINGPTIDLLRVIANCWGNITYGFRELSQANGESTVESFAWELETNAKNTKVFTVPHKRYTKNGSYPLTDPRDIYETVANNAERRVRACLEAIIPPDVVEDAVAQCRETMRAKADVTPDAIKKLVDAFAKIGVTGEQLEARLQRRIETMQPAQLVGLRRIWKSISDGMSKPADWFQAKEDEQPPQTAGDAAKDALKKRATKPEPPPEETHDRPQSTDDVDEAAVEHARETLAGCTDEQGVQFELESMASLEMNEPTREAIAGAAHDRRAALREAEKPKGKGKQGTLT